jgi:hypothetical protein
MMTQINLERAIPKRKLSWDSWRQSFSVKPSETINFTGAYQLYADDPTMGVWVKQGKEFSAFVFQYQYNNAWLIFRNNLGQGLDIADNEKGHMW